MSSSKRFLRLTQLRRSLLPIFVLIILSLQTQVMQLTATSIDGTGYGFIMEIGRTGSEDGEFNFPWDVTVWKDRLYVVDYNNFRVQYFDLYGNFQDTLDSFYYPRAIAGDENYIYVSDNDNVVNVYDYQSQDIADIGEYGTGDGQFYLPMGLDTNGTHLFVADSGNHRIQIFNSSRHFVAKFGSLGNGNGEFNVPTDVAVNETHILVLDTENHRVQIFNSTGGYEATIGSYGFNDGQFAFPYGITFNGTNIFVADSNRIQIFDLAGNYVDKIVGGMVDVHGITVDGPNVYVSNTEFDNVMIFAPYFNPENLIATEGLGHISLTWDEGKSTALDPAKSYRVYRGIRSGNYTLLAETVSRHYHDTELVSDQIYYYVVTAVTNRGESNYSIEVSAQAGNQYTITNTETETEILTDTQYITTEVPTVTGTTVETDFTSTVTTFITEAKSEAAFPAMIGILSFILVIIVRRKWS